MTEKKSNEITLTRIYDAPVQRVWQAWIDPKQVGQWWGPRGFTITTYNKDVRPGGTWRYTMHGPDGTNYENMTTFLEVEEGARLVYDHGATETTPPMFRVHVTFVAVGEKTKMDMRMIFPSPEAATEAGIFIKKAGGYSTWDRLGEFLYETIHKKNRFVIHRTFQAPIDVVYAMWSDPKHVTEWSPPTGCTMEFLRCDLRPGGDGFYKMSGPNNAVMYGKTHYIELTKPTRVVYTQQFSNEKAETVRHPMAPNWPLTMTTVVELTAEGPNETRIALTWEPCDDATAEEIETFRGARSGMTQGWTGSFDKLEAYLPR